MPIIERIKQMGQPEEIRELILNVPDKSGIYPTAYGEMEIILGPVVAKFGQVNLRKMILQGSFFGDKRRVTKLHPSPKIPILFSLNEMEFLSVKSKPIHKKKGRERLAI